MTYNDISVVVPDFFVYPSNKTKGSGSGEAKLYLGTASKENELNTFFNEFDESNKYFLKKSNLLEILKNLKIEFCFQQFRKYENISLAAWDAIYNEIYVAPNEELLFDAIPYLATGEGKGQGQYFLTSKDVNNDCWGQLLRKVCLPKITTIKIHKNLLDSSNTEYFFEVLLNFDYPSKDVNSNGYNKIIYGAPGSGKSKYVEGLVRDKQYFRTVFHQETQYSDFIGCLKPHKNGESISYSFRKGPFIQILEDALSNPRVNYCLIIEELNRANTAAAFGEIFQLLDRDSEGNSEYPIFIQDEDLFNDLMSNSKLKKHPLIKNRKLIIPKNLSIIATMNSSDQAVFPLDTAFKRRWIFEYLPIDFTQCATGKIPTYDTDIPNIDWKDLAQVINKVLVQLNVVEDKLIGPWFVKDSDLMAEVAKDTFIGKICSYLWDDALKYKSHNDKIFKCEIYSYGQLHQLYSNEEAIFSEKFIEMLKDQHTAGEHGQTESE